MRRRYNLNLPVELVERVDAAAGDVPRSRWVERALEAALAGIASESRSLPSGGAKDSLAAADAPPASPRAPEERPVATPPVAERIPTAAQLAGRTGMPLAACRRALEDGSWETLL